MEEEIVSFETAMLQNKFGVCWCVRCGYLFRNLEYTPLLQSDILIIK